MAGFIKPGFEHLHPSRIEWPGWRDSKAPPYLSDNIDAESLSQKSDSLCPQIGAQEFDLSFHALSWVVAKWGSLSDEATRKIVALAAKFTE